MKFWLNDPVRNVPSVSLSLMVISFAVAMIISVLQVFKQVENGGMCLEIFYATSALYFGNKFTAQGKQVTVMAEKIQQLDNQESK